MLFFLNKLHITICGITAGVQIEEFFLPLKYTQLLRDSGDQLELTEFEITRFDRTPAFATQDPFYVK